MKLILISSPHGVSHEMQIIISLIENGLQIFQVNKPDLSEEEVRNYILQFPEKYQSRIFLHSDFLKFHSLEELQVYKERCEYAFLSPIFDSISKKGYRSTFTDQAALSYAISGKNIIALGGIDEDKIDICRKLGFAGVAVCGAIWNSSSIVEKFKRLKALCEKEKFITV